VHVREEDREVDRKWEKIFFSFSHILCLLFSCFRIQLIFTLSSCFILTCKYLLFISNSLFYFYSIGARRLGSAWRCQISANIGGGRSKWRGASAKTPCVAQTNRGCFSQEQRSAKFHWDIFIHRLEGENYFLRYSLCEISRVVFIYLCMIYRTSALVYYAVYYDSCPPSLHSAVLP